MADADHCSQPFPGSLLGNRTWLLFVALVAAVLCVPFFRFVYWVTDEAVLLNGAERLLRGSRLYVDFFEFLPPGGFFLTEGWFSIAGISVGSARSLAVLTIVGIACFTYLACWHASKNAPLSAALATGCVVILQGWVQVSHHYLTTLFSMVTAWAALANIEHPQRWLRLPLIGGAAAGMAVMVTPHRGALVMLAAVTSFLNLRQHRMEFIGYVLGCALVPAALLAYLVGNHALIAAFDDVVLFTVTRYAAIQSVPFGFGFHNHPLEYLIPLGAALTLFVCARDWRTCRRDCLFWQCAAFALAGFVGCFPRPDLRHITYAVPLACPLLACCVIRLIQWWSPAWWRYRYLVVVVAGVVIGLCARTVIDFLEISREALRAEIVPTPRGDVVFFERFGAPELLARIGATPSGDAYFFYPLLSMLPFLTARQQVSKYDVFTPGYTLPSQYRDACKSVMRQASWVVIDRRMTDPNLLKQMFPTMRDGEPRETKQFERALNNGFELYSQEGPLELRRRRGDISDALCADIAE